MNRRLLTSAAFSLGVAASTWAGLASIRQDDSGAIEALDARVTVLESAVFGTTPSASIGDARSGVLASGESVTVSGAGIGVVGPFALEAQLHEVLVLAGPSASDAAFRLDLYDADASQQTISNRTGVGAGGYEGTLVLEVRAAGDYYLSASETDATWSVTFTPLPAP